MELREERERREMIEIGDVEIEMVELWSAAHLSFTACDCSDSDMSGSSEMYLQIKSDFEKR